MTSINFPGVSTPLSGSIQFTTTGANTWEVPAGVQLILVSGVAAGGGGGGGGTSGGNAGGGGGSAGQPISNMPIPVTPGDTLTINIPTSPSGGAATAHGSTGGN